MPIRAKILFQHREGLYPPQQRIPSAISNTNPSAIGTTTTATSHYLHLSTTNTTAPTTSNIDRRPCRGRPPWATNNTCYSLPPQHHIGGCQPPSMPFFPIPVSLSSRGKQHLALRTGFYFYSLQTQPPRLPINVAALPEKQQQNEVSRTKGRYYPEHPGGLGEF